MPTKKMTKEEISKLLENSIFGHLAFARNNEPYVLPVNYVFSDDKIYIHCAFEGKKIDFINSNPKVCFEVCEADEIIPHAKPCKYSIYYRSVLVYGEAKIIDEDLEAKKHALIALMDKYSNGKKYDDFKEKEVDNVNIIEIAVSHISSKELYPSP